MSSDEKTKFLRLSDGRVRITVPTGIRETAWEITVSLDDLVQFVLDLPIEAVVGAKFHPHIDTVGELLKAEAMKAGQRNRIFG